MPQFGNGFSTPPGYPQPGAPTGSQTAYCFGPQGPYSCPIVPGQPFYCVQFSLPNPWNITGSYVTQATGLSGVTGQSGPWPDYATAAANCGGPQPAPTGPTQPPSQPTQPAPPTQPTQPAANPFWLVCSLQNGTSTAQILSFPDVATLRANVPGVQSVTGPFPTFDDANAQFPAFAASCDKRQTPALQCGIKPLFNCPEVPPGLSALGTPGTAEWCKAVDNAVNILGNVGTALFKFIDERLDANLVLQNIDDYLNSGEPSIAIVPFIKLMRAVVCWIGPDFETLRTAIGCVKTWMGSLFPNCRTEALFGLLTIRHVLLTLERIEWGTDAALWVVANSGFMIDPLMTTLDYLIRYACPVELMSEGDVMEVIKHWQVDDDTAKCLLAAHGKQFDQMRTVLNARGEKMHWREAIQWLRRHGQSEETTDKVLRTLGFFDPAWRDAARELYDELPTISDHLHWLQRNVFDDEYVRDFDLLNGFEDRFWKKFGPDLHALGMKKEYAQLHYAAHWINPAFTQLFGMVQRLRVGRVNNNLVFTRADLLRVMAEMDVAPYFRERLEAVSHPIPNLSQCLQLFQFGTIDKKELIEKLKDLGFDDYNAGIQADSQEIKVRRLNASSGHGWTPAVLASAYAVGKITAAQVKAEMAYLGYSADSADRLMRRAEIELSAAPVRRIHQQIIRSALTTQEKAYKCGAIAPEALLGVFRNAGIPDGVAKIAIANVDSEIDVALCEKQIQTFRSALFKGKITLEQARDLLQAAGVPALRIAQFLKSWAVEFQVRAPAATAAQLLRWVGLGLIDPATARIRLVNLGWTDPDLALSLAESLSKLASLQARLQRQSAQSQTKAAKAALQAQKEALAVAQRLRSQLRGIASIRTLQSWYTQDLIDNATFLEYAQARGYPLSESEKYLAEAQRKWAKAHKPPKAPAPVKRTGEPSVTGLERYFKEGILDEAALRGELTAQGLSPLDIDRAVQDAWSKATKGQFVGPTQEAQPPAPSA